jgi:Skp family chaperone for outer membrane proteins
MGNKERSKRTLAGTVILGAILVLSSLNGPHPASAEAKSSAQLDAELSAKKAELDKAQADLPKIKAGIAAIDRFLTLPEGRFKREAKNQAYRAYLQYVEGLNPDLAPIIDVVASPEQIKKSLEKEIPGIERKISNLNTEIGQLRVKVQVAKATELSQQHQQLQPGGSSGGSRSQSGPPQPPTYTAPPQPPPAPGSAGAQPPPLPPGTYVTGFEVFCPGEAVAKEPVRCTARGVYSHDPNTVVNLTESTTWDITGATEWKSGSEFRTKGAAVIIVTATRGNNRVTRTVHVKARRTETGSGTKPEGGGSAPAVSSPPTGGGGCGPGRSDCTCPGGARGHIPCDPDKGACHCETK